jgi:RNA polymerase sigma-70 factor (ECF subfamily)
MESNTKIGRMMDPKPFEAFMGNYQNMVFTTAVRLLANEAEAQDIAQEVFLRAYDHFSEISQSPTAGGWLKTVTRNLCLNHLSRYRARWRFFSEMRDSENEEVPPLEFAAPDTHDQEVDRADHRELLEHALKKLPDSQRIPLVLFHFEGLAYEAIAERLNVSLSKVKTDIFRGREALRPRLKWCLKEEQQPV